MILLCDKADEQPELRELLLWFQHADDKYYLIAGHTGEAVFKKDGPHDIYININDVQHMSKVTKVPLRNHIKHVDVHVYVVILCSV